MLKNITLSAESHLINLAREKARSRNETLNSAFRKWLIQYAKNDLKLNNYTNLMKTLNYVNAGKHFTRDDLNER